LLLAASLPLPFSLLSHAAAQPAGAATAIAVDAVHLLGASIWAGGVVTPRHEVVDAEQQHGQPAKKLALTGRR
jgi:putative copper export protein